MEENDTGWACRWACRKGLMMIQEIGNEREWFKKKIGMGKRFDDNRLKGQREKYLERRGVEGKRLMDEKGKS